MMPLIKNDIVLITDGDYTGKLYVVNKSWMENDLCLCECLDMNYDCLYYFDNLCCVPIGRILTTFKGIDYYIDNET